ncbi:MULTISPECIES: hypothetical protein [unclassified Ruegeria]|nr:MULTISPECIES: hypothetical protein [unclassified Ruegeria]
MKARENKTSTPRDLFERKIHHQFGLSGAVLRSISELRYPGKS